MASSVAESSHEEGESAALEPLQQAQNKEAASQKHTLPESLEKFTTLAEEKDIIEVAEPLRALEAAVARDPDSKEAAAALDAAVKKLIEVMKAKIEERADKADLKALLKECEATITAGNRDFEKVYRAVWAVLQSGEEHLLPRCKKAVDALRERIKKPNDKPEQRKEAKEPVTLLADAAHTKPVFEVVAEHLATLGSGTRLEMQRVGDKDKHGHETSGLKKLQRVVEKALLKPAGDATVGETDSVLDVVRAMIVVKDLGVVAAIVDGLKTLSDAELVDVLRLKNRFESPSAGGWRDLMINLVIVGDERRHVCEIQIVHEMMLTARKGLPGHAIYAIVRNANELVDSCGMLTELRAQEVRAMRETNPTEMQVVAAFEDAPVLEDEGLIGMIEGGKATLGTLIKAGEDGRLAALDLKQQKLGAAGAAVVTRLLPVMGSLTEVC